MILPDRPSAVPGSNRFAHLRPTAVFDSYWRFAAERQAIFVRRLAGMPAPWTDDPILARHRFTNAYRAADRVSQFLIREVIYGDGRSRTPRETLFRV
ncbi:MAG TPA: nucleotide kinase domain-containing protein, partial [Stellaceae bacterium]|nr:nucleotide kinase domain-containing protein [Stellaceae bacterium]